MTSPKTWQEEFWEIVDEKGNGANVDLPLSLEKLFTKTLAFQAKGLREAMEKVQEKDTLVMEDEKTNTEIIRGIHKKHWKRGFNHGRQEMLAAFDKALKDEV